METDAVNTGSGEPLPLDFELSEKNFGDHRVRAHSPITLDKELYNESERLVICVESDQLDNIVSGIDNAFKQDVSLLWVDVQGHEGYVWLGARELLSTGIPVVSGLWPYGIQRAGMSCRRYCDIAGEIWSSYWVMRNGKFIRYPIQVLDCLFDELGNSKDFASIIFTSRE